MTFLCVFASFLSHARGDTTFYDEYGRKVSDWQSADYYGFARKEGDKYHIRQNWLSGKPKIDIVTTSPEQPTQDAYFKLYNAHGKEIREGQYKNGVKEGVWKYFNERNSSLSNESNFTRGTLNGTETFYDSTGKVTGKRVYDNYKLVSETVIDSLSASAIILDGNQADSEKMKHFVWVEKMPEFPGGKEGLNRFLMQNMTYPMEEREAGRQGVVAVRFTIDENGVPGDFDVVKSVSPGCNMEVLRVLTSMPAWSPGIYKGKPIKVYYTIPFTFRLD
ncbi:TonB family protein [Chitinophagaceae bacterium MMS25-I14]